MAITINGTSGISGVDGSAGTPAVIGSDADTGFVFAAGQITASLNGSGANVPLVQGTAQNSTSGTSIDFTGIPSWVKRITVMFSGVSTSGTSNLLVQIGSGSFVTTGYLSTSTAVAASSSTGLSTATTGFNILQSLATDLLSGHMILTNITSNAWVSFHCAKRSGNASLQGGGDVSLSGTLDRVRITTVNGTDTFDAGSINIMYE